MDLQAVMWSDMTDKMPSDRHRPSSHTCVQVHLQRRPGFGGAAGRAARHAARGDARGGRNRGAPGPHGACV